MSEAGRYVGVKQWSEDDVAWLRASSAADGAARRAEFASVERVCLFIGYPRSGHSLVGSLLDAHRHAVIAHELDLLHFVQQGFTREQLYSLILSNVAEFGEAGRQWTDYSYDVPGQWQGRAESRVVMGDKKGGRSVRRIAGDPDVLERLQETVGVPIQLVHVIRNPWDNISTRQRRKTHQQRQVLIDRHFFLCAAVRDLKERLAPSAVLDVRHEDVIADPRRELQRLCAFVGLDAPPTYLDACAGIVFPSTRRTRDSVEWTGAQIGEVAARAADVPFLAGYTFDD